MARLTDLETFIAIVEQGSLTEAARRLERSLQSVSRSLNAVEAEVGAELIHRTTRRVAPSEAGAAFYHRIKSAVADINEAVLEASHSRSEPAGVLRIGAPMLFGPDYLVPIIADYQALYPRVEVDLQLSDTFVDMASAGLDLVVRIAELPDSGLQGKQLGSLRRVVFGTPSYFARHGRPQHPKELSAHNCLVRSVDAHPGKWVFAIDGRPKTITVGGTFKANTTMGLYAAVRAGMGLAFSPLWQVRDLVASGEFELVLEAYEPKPIPIHVLWQENRMPPAKIRTFVDLLSSRLKLRGL